MNDGRGNRGIRKGVPRFPNLALATHDRRNDFAPAEDPRGNSLATPEGARRNSFAATERAIGDDFATTERTVGNDLAASKRAGRDLLTTVVRLHHPILPFLLFHPRERA